MRGLKLITSAAVLFFTAVACGMLGDAEEAVKAQEEFANRACACSDIACIQGIQEEQAEWMKENGADLLGADEEDAQRITAATEKMAKCAQDIAQGGGSSGGKKSSKRRSKKSSKKSDSKKGGKKGGKKGKKN